MSESKTQLHKEFELERLILFSDAVFAIAITLIIIEIKFPDVEKGATSAQIWQAFKPTVIQFVAFVFSFFLIGLSWMRHLEIFRYISKYDKSLIVRNLFFLFFIVCFPFSASGLTEHIRPGFLLPVSLYMFNIAAVYICQFFLCKYVFSTKPQLSVEGYNEKKNYLLLNSKEIATNMAITVAVYIVIFIFSSNELALVSPPYLLVVLMLISKRKLKKHKPALMDEM